MKWPFNIEVRLGQADPLARHHTPIAPSKTRVFGRSALALSMDLFLPLSE